MIVEKGSGKMRIRMRERFSYASVVATFALVFAMTGGALAASKILITSTKQIKPSVLKQLQGRVGAQGPTGTVGAQGPSGPAGKDGQTGAQGPGGPQGPQGPAGAEGKEGSPWTAGGILPSGKSEQGQWAIEDGVSELDRRLVAFSFPIPLGENPTAAHFIGLEEGAGEPKEATAIKNGECGGTVAAPSAGPGNLCIFAKELVNFVAFPFSPVIDGATGSPGAGVSGAYLKLIAPETGVASASGTWIVTSA